MQYNDFFPHSFFAPKIAMPFCPWISLTLQLRAASRTKKIIDARPKKHLVVEDVNLRKLYIGLTLLAALVAALTVGFCFTDVFTTAPPKVTFAFAGYTKSDGKDYVLYVGTNKTSGLAIFGYDSRIHIMGFHPDSAFT